MFARSFQKVSQRATQITSRRFGSHAQAPAAPVLGMEKVDFNKSTKPFLPGDHLHEAPVSWSFNRPVVAGGSVHKGWTFIMKPTFLSNQHVFLIQLHLAFSLVSVLVLHHLIIVSWTMSGV